MLSSSSGSEEDGDEESGTGYENEDEEYSVGSRVYVLYDDGEAAAASVYAADIIAATKKAITVCYETDSTTEKINRWALVERLVPKRMYEAQMRKLERSRADETAEKSKRAHRKKKASAGSTSASKGGRSRRSAYKSSSDSEVELDATEGGASAST